MFSKYKTTAPNIRNKKQQQHSNHEQRTIWVVQVVEELKLELIVSTIVYALLLYFTLLPLSSCSWLKYQIREYIYSKLRQQFD